MEEFQRENPANFYFNEYKKANEKFTNFKSKLELELKDIAKSEPPKQSTAQSSSITSLFSSNIQPILRKQNSKMKSFRKIVENTRKDLENGVISNQQAIEKK